MFKAISDGHRAFIRIAIVADTAAPTPPCGACRQVLWEFGGNLEIQLANLSERQGRLPAERPPAAAVRRATSLRTSSGVPGSGFRVQSSFRVQGSRFRVRWFAPPNPEPRTPNEP